MVRPRSTSHFSSFSADFSGSVCGDDDRDEEGRNGSNSTQEGQRGGGSYSSESRSGSASESTASTSFSHPTSLKSTGSETSVTSMDSMVKGEEVEEGKKGGAGYDGDDGEVTLRSDSGLNTPRQQDSNWNGEGDTDGKGGTRGGESEGERGPTETPPSSSTTPTTVPNNNDKNTMSIPFSQGSAKGRYFVRICEGRDLILPFDPPPPSSPALHNASVMNPPRPYVLIQFDRADSYSVESGLEPADSSRSKGKRRLGNFSSSSSTRDRTDEPSTRHGRVGTSGSEELKTIVELRTPKCENDGFHLEGEGSETSRPHSPDLGVVRDVVRNPVWNHEAIFDVVSAQRSMTISVWISDTNLCTAKPSTTNSPETSNKSSSSSPPLSKRPGMNRHSSSSGSVSSLASSSSGVGGSILVGRAEFCPLVAKDGEAIDSWISIMSRDGSQTTGQVHVQTRFEEQKSRRRLTEADFEKIQMIGEGSFGVVFKVRKKDTRRIYAMKIIDKSRLQDEKSIVHALAERKVLSSTIDSPFLVGLKFSFQTPKMLFLVMDYKSGGELFKYLQREGGRFDEDRVRFYIGEIVLALEYLHQHNIIYRDLKPENVLLDASGHVSLCDFGLSKSDVGPDGVTSTFCGTGDFLAPEMLNSEQGYSRKVDFWALGVLFYEMVFGYTPFYSEDKFEKYYNIMEGPIKIPQRGISAEGRDLLVKLLTRDPAQRLGAHRDAAEIKEHPFFAELDWDALANLELEPPFKPPIDWDCEAAGRAPQRKVSPAPSRTARVAQVVSRRSSVATGRTENAAELTTKSSSEEFRGFTFSRETGSGSASGERKNGEGGWLKKFTSKRTAKGFAAGFGFSPAAEGS